MAEKTKRPKKKRASFEDAFAMALRATFAQDEIRAPEPESEPEPVATLELAEAGAELEAVAELEALAENEAKSIEAEAVVSEAFEPTTYTDEVHAQSELTKCTEEINADSEQALCTDEITIQNEQTNCTEEIDRQNEQTNQTDEVSIHNEPTKLSNQINTQNEIAKQTGETDVQSEPTKYADKVDIQSEQSTCIDETNELIEQTNQTNETTIQNEHTPEVLSTSTQAPSIHPESELKIHLRKSLIESKAEHALVAYLQANGNHVSSYALISEETGIPVGTLRRCFKKFIEYELISTTKYCGRGKMQGIIITIRDLQAALDNVQITHRSSPKQLATYAGGMKKSGHGQAVQIVHWLRRLCDADIAMLWPALSAIQFGAQHIAQALETLQAQGKVFDQKFGEDFKQGLDHADFALGNKGGIKDRHGRAVAKPCDYIYSSLAKDGYYPAPDNYVSPQAQRAADEAARLAKERAMFGDC